MLKVKTNSLELRGVTTHVSQKTGKTYYMIFCEDLETFEPYKFMCREFDAIEKGLDKGDIVELSLEYNGYKELVVKSVRKVG